MTELKNCPFCGGSAELGCDQFGEPAVGCLDIRCQGATHYSNGCDSNQEAVDKWNRRADGWISVDEKLPSDGQACDILTKHGGRHADFEFGVETEHMNAGWSSDDGSIDFTVAQITHWMPLPECPK